MSVIMAAHLKGRRWQRGVSTQWSLRCGGGGGHIAVERRGSTTVHPHLLTATTLRQVGFTGTQSQTGF